MSFGRSTIQLPPAKMPLRSEGAAFKGRFRPKGSAGFGAKGTGATRASPADRGRSGRHVTGGNRARHAVAGPVNGGAEGPFIDQKRAKFYGGSGVRHPGVHRCEAVNF